MSRSDRFDRGDFELRYNPQGQSSATNAERPAAQAVAPPREGQATRNHGPALIWPIDLGQLLRVGQSVLKDRNGKGRPHKGIDLFAAAGTPVLAALDGLVLRVVDGRRGVHLSQRRAGLFIDVLGSDWRVYRYLHLGSTPVKSGQAVSQGSVLGTVAAVHTSGLGDTPQLHFEIRAGDVDPAHKDYGAAIDPRRLLPPLRA